MSTAIESDKKTVAYPKVRRIKFPFGDAESNDRYFIKGEIVFSHFLANLSGGFPAGEEGFIRSVRRFADDITDPVLKKRVAGFIGQEAMHGREHRLLNDRLIELGYPIAWLDSDPMKERMIRLENRASGRAHLAATAAAEHFTAVLAERVLSSDEIQAIPGEPEVWNLLNWHVMEELEHKSVVFDVYKAVGGSEFTRITTMFAIIAFSIPFTLGGILVSILTDPYARTRPLTVLGQTWKLFRGPMFRGLLPELARYMKPGFHPDDIDTNALLEKWQAELFGADGTLVDHLK